MAQKTKTAKTAPKTTQSATKGKAASTIENKPAPAASGNTPMPASVQLDPAERAEFLGLVRDFLKVCNYSEVFPENGNDYALCKPALARWKPVIVERCLRAARQWRDAHAVKHGYAQTKDEKPWERKGPAEPTEFLMIVWMSRCFYIPFDAFGNVIMPPDKAIGMGREAERELREAVGLPKAGSSADQPPANPQKVEARWITEITDDSISVDALDGKRKRGSLPSADQGPSGRWSYALDEVCKAFPAYESKLRKAAQSI